MYMYMYSISVLLVCTCIVNLTFLFSVKGISRKAADLMSKSIMCIDHKQFTMPFMSCYKRESERAIVLLSENKALPIVHLLLYLHTLWDIPGEY